MNVFDLGRPVTLIYQGNEDGQDQNTLLEFEIFPVIPIGGFIVPVSLLTAGGSIGGGAGGVRIDGSYIGTVSQNTIGVLTLRFKWGGVTIVTHVVNAPAVAYVNAGLFLWWTIRRRPVPAGGGTRIHACVGIGDVTATNGMHYHKLLAGTGAAAGDQPFIITGQWSQAAVANSFNPEQAQMVLAS